MKMYLKDTLLNDATITQVITSQNAVQIVTSEKIHDVKFHSDNEIKFDQTVYIRQ